MAGLFEFSIDTAEVSQKGNAIQEYGTQLQSLLARFGDTIENLKSSGMQGEHEMKLASSYEAIAPDLTKYANAMIAVGGSVAQSAMNSEATAEAVAGNLQVV